MCSSGALYTISLKRSSNKLISMVRFEVQKMPLKYNYRSKTSKSGKKSSLGARVILNMRDIEQQPETVCL